MYPPMSRRLNAQRAPSAFFGFWFAVFLPGSSNVLGDITVTVPAEACVFFAGQSQTSLEISYPPTPDWQSDPWDVAGLGSSANFHNDTAPWAGVVRAENNAGEAEGFTIARRTAASTTPPYINVSDITSLSIAASGNWGAGPLMPHVGPNGQAGGSTLAEYDDLGISLVSSCLSYSLVGVFLSNDPPNASATPEALICGTSTMTVPTLQQSFYIGAAISNVTVPPGATRLFLGFRDEGGWWNNDGDATVVISGTGTDTDMDGVIDAWDNCPSISNANQSNIDSDGFGDVCDQCPNDPTNNIVDGECVPTLSEWGVIAMGLLTLAAGTVVMMRRRVAGA